MSFLKNTKNIISIILLIYIILSAFYTWIINLISQQRVFALVIASDFFALSMLVNIYASELTGEVKKIWLYLGVFGLVVFLIFALLTYL
jgi:hypothetical protein